MPEGHSVHRIARQFAEHFVGHVVGVSSPQGRFAVGAAELTGRTMLDARASGKQMFLEFSGDRWLRVHLGMYGAWDFAGIGLFGSVGAPRILRMAESEKLGAELMDFPPAPVGQVRVRLLTSSAVADLRGPAACEVLGPAEVDAFLARLGPDPLVDVGPGAEERFVATVLAKPTPIGLLLMDQAVVGGIGNVYRAELLFRAKLDPHIPGKRVPVETLRALWHDWVYLLTEGVRTGQMLTMDGLDGDAYARALASRDDRHWVYHRAGLPCRVCGTPIVVELMAARKLYYCQSCQS